mmetsp:Transcript_42901/g.130551  ORF Transcript_42901/g.130551 Transcript_42901/m.130551 type:complete len:313 (-) Transcript_42901:18-956(-)
MGAPQAARRRRQLFLIGALLLPLANAFVVVIEPRLGSSRFAKCNDDTPDIQCKALRSITDRLQQMKDDMLTLSHDASDTDAMARDPSTGLSVRETLLSTRLLGLDLKKTRLDESTLAGAGRGLFATKHISKGGVITCYPGDALLCATPCSSEEGDEYEEESLDFHDDWVEENVLWGSHVSEAHRIEEDAVFDGIEGADRSETIPPLTDYAVAVCNTYSVMGMPSLDTDPAYYGHFANDGAGHFATKKAYGGASAEEGIAAYVLESVEASNAMHQSVKGGLHMVTVATKDIQEGEEILVTYGPDYWMQHSSCK